MPSLEIISGFTTAPGATEAPLTMATGNSLTIRNFDESRNAFLITMFGLSNSTGIFKVRSPLLHDNTQGIRFRTQTTRNKPYLPLRLNQRLYPQDTLAVTLSGSATGGHIEVGCLLNYYEDIPGISGRFISPSEAYSRARSIVTQELSITAGTAGGWSGTRALNADFDLLKANTDYALIGYSTNTLQAGFRIYGPDSGNLGVGGPMDVIDKSLTSQFFLVLSEKLGLDVIPVFSSANKSNTFVEVANNQAAASVVLSLIFLELF